MGGGDTVLLPSIKFSTRLLNPFKEQGTSPLEFGDDVDTLIQFYSPYYVSDARE
jgi:hypothetical protein